MAKNIKKGSLLIEGIVAIAIFSIGFYGLLSLYRVIEEVSLLNTLKSGALIIAENEIDNLYPIFKKDFDTEVLPIFSTSSVYTIKNYIEFENEASKIIKSKISFLVYGRENSVELNLRVVDLSRADGLSTCSDYFDDPSLSIKGQIDLSSNNFKLGEKNQPTDIDVVGNYAYVTFDSGVATDTDLAIFDLNDWNNPVLISSLDTGPGLSALHVRGRVVYVANNSINGQMQVIDLSDIYHPYLHQSIKLPGIYKGGTTLGKKVWYSNDKVYLGTGKSDAGEVYIFDAKDARNIVYGSSYEVNSGVNDIVANKNNLFIANPTDNELIGVNVSDIYHHANFASYNAPAGTGNGKSLALLGNRLVLGRTLGNKELYLLDISSSSINKISEFDRNASVDGLILKTNTLFSITPQSDDMFQVFDISSSTIKKINSNKIVFTSRPFAFDCDKTNFFVLTGKIINIISP